MSRLVYQRKNGKWEARYSKGKDISGKIIYGTVYGNTEAEAIARRIKKLGYDPDAVQYKNEMNLLIIGAGVHGHDCKAIAESLRIFKKIKFLDDVVKDNPDVIGITSDLSRYRYEFPCSFIAIGDNEARKFFVEKLRGLNYMLPSLISPYANISAHAIIGDGVVAFPGCTVNEAQVGDFSILDTNTVINSGAVVADYTRVDCGGIVLKGIETSVGAWIKSGEIYGR